MSQDKIQSNHILKRFQLETLQGIASDNAAMLK